MPISASESLTFHPWRKPYVGFLDSG